jgi:asparagine synthase (glutamine-hydrolysing)
VRRAAARVAAGLVPRRHLETAQGLARHVARQPWLDERWFAAQGAGSNRPVWEGRASLSEALATSFASTNLPSLLRYEDRNSMIHSIESRVPFLTRSLVEFIFTLPEHFLIADDGINKSILRSALRGLVPDAILDRRDKIGFATPERGWLKRIEGWVTPILASDAARALQELSEREPVQELPRCQPVELIDHLILHERKNGNAAAERQRAGMKEKRCQVPEAGDAVVVEQRLLLGEHGFAARTG